MKRLIALMLCFCFVLSACGVQQETPDPSGTGPHAGQETAGDGTQMQSGASAGQESGAQAEKLALRLAAIPQLPKQPDEGELEKALSELDYDKLGEEKYRAEQDKLWQEFQEQQTAYYNALQELHGSGVDADVTGALAAYTKKLAGLVLADPAIQAASAKNAVFSPANLYLALCMLAETTDGESRAQILSLLGLSSAEQARATANSLWRALWNESGSGKTLLANSVWLNEQMNYHEDTVDTLAEDYLASTFRAPMGVKTTDEAIAAWINDNTGHLLEKAAGGLQTQPETLMMLISTLYFKSQWTDQFSEFGTEEDTFTNALGAEEKIDFMHRTDAHGRCALGEGWKMAELRFRDGMAMRFLLPDEGERLDALLSDDATLDTFLRGSADEQTVKILWSVPKFDVDCDIDLIPTLEAAGLTAIFDPERADFSPLTDLPAVVSAAKHAARVKVDEEGCEAAAFTAFTVNATSAMPQELPVVEMDLDRPFAFLITGADGLPLFLAAVNTVQ